jgi:pyruvate,orthophosphate dikinase
VILVRAETSPDDVQGMAKAVGVLTSRGGLASHAAVVARGWGIAAVVGAEAVKVGDRQVEIGGRVFKAGDTITIDGATGEIFSGAVPQSTTAVPELATLRAWARELKSLPLPLSPEVEGAVASRDDALRTLFVKGSASPDGLAEALMAGAEPVRSMLAALEGEGLVESQAEAVRLTHDGQSKGRALLAADQFRWGSERAQAALDAFHALDLGVKEAVTAWQLRTVDGAQALNDHTDAAYDAGVLDRIADLHRDTAAWLQSMSGAPEGLSRYLSRLERALALASNGDQRFVASPRVDSYHGVWFELHEELILLAGRSRAEESAAGRA